MIHINAPRKCCPVQEPPPGESCRPCPEHSCDECDITVDMLKPLGKVLRAGGYLPAVFSLAGAVPILEDQVLSRLPAEHFAILRASCHAAYYAASYPMSKKDQLQLVSYFSHELSLGFESVHERCCIQMDKTLEVLLHESTITRFSSLDADISNTNVKALFMFLRTVQFGLEVERLLSEDQSEDTLQRVVDMFATNSNNNKMYPSELSK